MNQFNIKEYQKGQVLTASRGEILVLLHNGAIQFLNMARKAMEEGNIVEVHNNIMGAQKILYEFQTTLDRKNGNELAQNLYNLYRYMNKRLIDANIHKNIEALDEVMNFIKEYRDTWSEVVENAKNEKKQNPDSAEEIETHDWTVGDDD